MYTGYPPKCSNEIKDLDLIQDQLTEIVRNRGERKETTIT